MKNFENSQSCNHNFFEKDANIKQNAKKAVIVIWITLATMIAEIYFGWVTGSMSLLADGWHMATHAAAIGVTYLTYRLAMSPRLVKNFNFGGGKLIPLGGFASSIFLLLVAIYVAIESFLRFTNPKQIHFTEALYVAAIGLIINLICAYILRPDHKNHHHAHHFGDAHHSHSGDHNIKGAYLHVVADALTSIAAILALLSGQIFKINWPDPVIGVLSSILIVHWAVQLIRETAWELLDGHANGINYDSLKSRIENTGAKIIDLHIWKVGPHALACELIVENNKNIGLESYRKILKEEFGVTHAVIEESAPRA